MKRIYLYILIALGLLFGFQYLQNDRSMAGKTMNTENNNYKVATFAGGCFWCTESDFEKVDGVIDAVSGYIGGDEENPTYQEVSAGTTGHAEAIKVTYDPGRVNYNQLLDVFWRHVDPTDPGGQFVDRGSQYRTAIFYHDAEQKKKAEASKAALDQSGRFKKPIVTEIVPFDRFYEAETYHQDYYKKSPLRYKSYRFHSGRDRFLKSAWADSKGSARSASMEEKTGSKPDEVNLREKLTPLQYQVTQEDGTEPPFKNEYWNNKQDGIYVDIVSGEPLFSSTDKFKSGTGWPSFTKPLKPDNVIEKEDRSFFMTRIEVRSRKGDSHLGHLFPDGPKPTGLRYCINSASLRFIPKDDLEKEGYGDFLKLFSKN